MRFVPYISSLFLIFPLAGGIVYAQQLSGGVSPSIQVNRGYSVTTVVSTSTYKDIKGDQLEADNSISVNIVNPSLPASQSGDMASFAVSPNSSLVELQNISHSALIEFGEGTSLSTLVKTKDNAVSDGKLSQASSSATIVIETELRAQENALRLSDSFDNTF